MWHDPRILCDVFVSRIKALLGSGAFGTVHRVMWHHSDRGESVKEEVAVKSMKGEASEEERVKFLQEAAIMGQFKHPNIVKIVGILVTESEVCTLSLS